jgi:aryl-alcohol dehydrogenase-like predicted oxidoreductase
MNYTNLGKTGLKVSRICLQRELRTQGRERERGPGQEQNRPFIKRKFVSLGINFLIQPTCMERPGEAVRPLRDLLKRAEVVIATKVYS